MNRISKWIQKRKSYSNPLFGTMVILGGIVFPVFNAAGAGFFQPANNGDDWGSGDGVVQEELELIELVWHDLFGGEFDGEQNGLFFRADLPVVIDGEERFDVAVLDVGSEVDFDVYSGASYKEHSSYQVFNFHGGSSFVEHEGNVLHISTHIDSVAGVLHNSEGESRILAGYVYVFSIDGTGPLWGSGISLSCFMPTKRFLSIEAADGYAFNRSYIPEEVDVTDCIYIEDYCEQQMCFCVADEDARFDCDTQLCNGITDPDLFWGGIGGGIVVGGGVGLRASAKKGNFWGVILGTAGAAILGGAAAGLIVEADRDRNCRSKANTKHNANKRFIRNEFARCRSLSDPVYVCPVVPCE